MIEGWKYITEDEGWGCAILSPDGEKILVKEVKQGEFGVEVKYNLIDYDTCKKSGTEILNT